MALVLTKLSHQWLRDWWWASVSCGRHLAKSRLLISRLKTHKGKESSGAPVAASNFCLVFFLWALRYVLNIRIHKTELQITENNAMFQDVWNVKNCGFIYFITVVTFSPLCILVCFRSLCFRRMCFRGCLLFGCVFVRYVFTGILQKHDIGLLHSFIKMQLTTECSCVYMTWTSFVVVQYMYLEWHSLDQVTNYVCLCSL